MNKIFTLSSLGKYEEFSNLRLSISKYAQIDKVPS